MEDFLKFIDNKYDEYLKNKNIKRLGYNVYMPLTPQDIDYVNSFKCLKSSKTRIIYEVETIRLDFTDYDIIQIISTFDKKVVKQMLNDFIEMYNGKFANFEFEIYSQKYEGIGIDYNKYENVNFDLYADVNINMHSFLFVVNMIIFKDIVGQGYYKRGDEINLLKKTLIKYIVLSEYYILQNESAQHYLKTVEFPYEHKLEKIFSNKLDGKKYDACFDEEIFESIMLV